MTEPSKSLGETPTLRLRVRQVTYQAIGVNSYEVSAENGGELPRFSAGAHIDVHSGLGHIRQYSLCNDPDERHRYVIAVLRKEDGRGGSIAIHDRFVPQRHAAVGTPRNSFRLVEGASRYLMLAGGIGITPLKAMAHRLEAIGADYTLHYCAKSMAHAAFLDELSPLADRGRVVIHCDGGNPKRGLDIASLLSRRAEGRQLYYCGPPGFMIACAQASSHWPSDAVHCEYFESPALPAAAPARVGGDPRPEDGFQVRIASSGRLLHVPGDTSIATILGRYGLDVGVSCESGLCGSCKVRYLSGEVDHKDYVLSEDERAEYLTTCVSRSKGAVLELDL